MNFYQRMGISSLQKARKSQFHDKTAYVWCLRYRWDPSLSMNPVRQFAHFMPPWHFLVGFNQEHWFGFNSPLISTVNRLDWKLLHRLVNLLDLGFCKVKCSQLVFDILISCFSTAVWLGIYGLPFSIQNQFSTDYSGTVGPIIMNLSAAPRDLKFDFDLMLKKHHPYSTSLLAAFALRA